jgi:cytochrome oxidase assembly protein ShyY1
MLLADDVSVAPKGGPYPKPLDIIQEHYVQPATHLTYAVTWYSLTIFGLFMTYKMFRPKTIRRRPI